MDVGEPEHWEQIAAAGEIFFICKQNFLYHSWLNSHKLWGSFCLLIKKQRLFPCTPIRSVGTHSVIGGRNQKKYKYLTTEDQLSVLKGRWHVLYHHYQFNVEVSKFSFASWEWIRFFKIQTISSWLSFVRKLIEWGTQGRKISFN